MERTNTETEVQIEISTWEDLEKEWKRKQIQTYKIPKELCNVAVLSLLEEKKKSLIEEYNKFTDHLLSESLICKIDSVNEQWLLNRLIERDIEDIDEFRRVKRVIREIRESLTLTKRNSVEYDKAAAKAYSCEAILRERGITVQRHMCKCPFHLEDTASLSIKQSDNTWKCFGCHEGGDSITLVMKLDGCSFIEALKKLQ